MYRFSNSDRVRFKLLRARLYRVPSDSATATTAATAATAATAVPAHAMEQAARDPAQIARESVTAGPLVGLPNILAFVKMWESVVPAEARRCPPKIFVPFLAGRGAASSPPSPRPPRLDVA